MKKERKLNLVKKTLLITQNYFPELGSAANRMKNFYDTLSEEGEVDIISTVPIYPDKRLYSNDTTVESENITKIDVKVKRYEQNLIWRLLLYIEVLCKTVFIILKRKKTYDTVIVSSPPIFILLAGVVAQKKWHSELIVDVRDLWPDSLLGVKKFTHPLFLKCAYAIEKRLYNIADKIIINSPAFEKNIMDKTVPKKKLTFIPNSLTQTEFLPKKKKKKVDNFIIIYTGNIGLAQDFEVLLKVSQKFQDIPQVQFLVIGYGFHIEKLREQIEENNLSDKVILLPPDSRINVLEKIKQADLAFLSLEQHEIFETVLPGKLVDYLGCGTPIVGAISGYSQSVLEEAQAGKAFKNKDIEGIVTYIKDLMRADTLREEMGNAGYLYAKEHFNWEVNKKKLKELCK